MIVTVIWQSCGMLGPDSPKRGAPSCLQLKD